MGVASASLLVAANCPPGTNVIQGTSSANTLTGTAGDDCILGHGGNDTIHGLGGNDFLIGGTGTDTINGNDGNDTLHGEDSNDFLYGHAGSDTLYGGGAADTLYGGDDADVAYGEVGNNSGGELGDGTTVRRLVPSAVAGGTTDWNSIGVGEGVTCGIRAGGQAYCWGYNRGTTPTQIGAETDWQSIDPVGSDICGIRAGQVYCWGRNHYGELGVMARSFPGGVSL